MVKIRDLKIKSSNESVGFLSVNENGKVFYNNGFTLIPYREVGHLYGCESCKHCIDKSYEKNFTQNNFYHQKPMSMPPACKCGLINKKYNKYDITFRCDNTHKHPVCKNFDINSIKNIGDETNINHFIDNKNSCVFSNQMVYINGISFNGKQAPFTFYINRNKWETLDFINNDCIEMINPLRWDMFNFNGEEYKGFEKYIELYGIPNNMTKSRFKKEWDLFGKPNRCGNFIGIFDFNIMWFKEI